MSSGGFQRPGGLDAGHAELLGLRKQLGSTITETDRFVEMVGADEFRLCDLVRSATVASIMWLRVRLFSS